MRNAKHLTISALTGALLLAAPGLAAQERGGTAAYADAYRPDRRAVTIPSGTDIPVTVEEDIPIDRERLGETFDAKVSRDVIVDGDVVIPEGAPARVRLLANEENEDQATLRLAEVEVEGEMRQVRTDDAKADTVKDRAETGKKTGIGAAAGAVVGAVTGAGVLRGAVIGAGGGLAWGLLSGRDTEVDSGTALSFELDESVEVR